MQNPVVFSKFTFLLTEQELADARSRGVWPALMHSLRHLGPLGGHLTVVEAWSTPQQSLLAYPPTDKRFYLKSIPQDSSATPQRIQCIFSSPGTASRITVPPPLNVLVDLPYQIIDTADLGEAVIATRTIQYGELIARDSPLLISTDPILYTLNHHGDVACPFSNPDKLEQVFRLAVQKMFRLDNTPELHYAVFDDVSRINHSCCPNAVARWDPSTLTIQVYALRSISLGEEITISYVDLSLPTADRQSFLRTRYNFACTCQGCENNDDDLLRAFLLQEHYSFDDIFDWARNPNPTDTTNKQHLDFCLSMMESRGLQGLEAYPLFLYQLVLVCTALGQTRVAEAHLDKWQTWWRIHGGPIDLLLASLRKHQWHVLFIARPLPPLRMQSSSLTV
ncbi:hypothetical protein ONZ45_g9166 [Pleurotus djamor]|nr:hypothetical protein ONZ45_g9166 [Pleurotus djamor]